MEKDLNAALNIKIVNIKGVTKMAKENKPLKSILFVSRNKDNKHIPNFKERRYVRLTTKTAERF